MLARSSINPGGGVDWSAKIEGAYRTKMSSEFLTGSIGSMAYAFNGETLVLRHFTSLRVPGF